MKNGKSCLHPCRTLQRAGIALLALALLVGLAPSGLFSAFASDSAQGASSDLPEQTDAQTSADEPAISEDLSKDDGVVVDEPTDVTAVEDDVAYPEADPDAETDSFPEPFDDAASDAAIMPLAVAVSDTPPKAVSLTATSQTAGSIKLQWNKSSQDVGYVLYRKADDPNASATESEEPGEEEPPVVSNPTPEDEGFTRISKMNSTNRRQYADADIFDNMFYTYRLYTYFNDSAGNVLLSDSYASSTIYKAPTPTFKSISRSSDKTSATIKWTKKSGVTGYQVQWSKNSVFATKKSTKVKGYATNSYTATGLTKSKTYYARVRSYVTYDGTTYYSPWVRSKNAGKATNMSIKRVKRKNGKALELRDRAGLKRYKYDTLEGCCANSTFAFYAMYNQNKEKCRIVKMRVSNRKVVKVSKVLNIGHGNDMTWNPDKNRIAVIHNTTNPLRISLINPKTLKVTKSVDIKVETKLDGATTSQVNNIKKLAGITYNSTRKQYVLLLGTSHNLLIVDQNFSAIAYVAPSSKVEQTYQGMTSTDDYLLISESTISGGSGNIIMIYDWDGTYVKRFTVPTAYEIEGVYFVGKVLYVGFYHSYYGTYYTTKKVKKKVTKKVKTKSGKKKKKTVTKIVTKKVAHRGTIRENYIYKATGL
ncbi:MAG: hypothetical protein LUD25_03140 [Coriobacteriaceae bacterium]|nr:hypothetical protein [Coriobacteriaceae bacterium]